MWVGEIFWKEFYVETLWSYHFGDHNQKAVSINWWEIGRVDFQSNLGLHSVTEGQFADTAVAGRFDKSVWLHELGSLVPIVEGHDETASGVLGSILISLPRKDIYPILDILSVLYNLKTWILKIYRIRCHNGIDFILG